MIVGLTFRMVKKIKTEWFVVNQSKMRKNFAVGLKNFHNVGLGGILGIALIKRKEIGLFTNERLHGNVKR